MPFVLGSVYFGGLVFFVPVALALLIAGWEFFDMTRRAGHPPIPWLGFGLIALILIDTQFALGGLREIIAAAVIVSLVIALFNHADGWITGWALTIVGALYVGVIGAYFILVRGLPNGLLWTTLALLTTWATDTGAYLVGTRIGKHGFFTRISPKKTWEGAIGGFVCAILAMLVLGAFVDLPIAHRILFGLGVSIAGTLGDLAESLLKRQTGVKDSSNIIPGHGGLLDRIDSMLFAGVFAYYYLIWILRI
jgi:phosphatidate cytidylyltransferase